MDAEPKQYTIDLTFTLDEWARISAIVAAAVEMSEQVGRDVGSMPEEIRKTCDIGLRFNADVAARIGRP